MSFTVSTIFGLVALFLASLGYLLWKSKEQIASKFAPKKDSDKKSDPSSPFSHLPDIKPIPHEEFEGEKFDFDVKQIGGYDEKTGKMSQNIVNLLDMRANAHPSRVAYIWTDKDANETGRMTFKELRNMVSGFAKDKLQKYVTPGDYSDERPKAMIILPPSLEYPVAFFSLMWAGFIVVPVYPPKDFAKESGRVSQIAKNAGAKYIIATKSLYYKIFAASMVMGDFKPSDYTWIYIDDIETMKKKYNVAHPIPQPVKLDSLAYLQYTSGSTSAPKGVRITHANIMAQNITMVHRFIPAEKDRLGPKVPLSCHCIIAMWAPPYHDFGLLTGVFTPCYAGCTNVLYSAMDFLANPVNWLMIMHKYQPMFTVSPNFGYNLIGALPAEIKKKYPIPYFTSLVCGAEPINPRTMHKVVEDFAPVNLCPGFGLAEFTLASCAQKDGNWETSWLVKSKFEQRIVEVVDDPKARAAYKPGELMELVSCGPPLFEAQHKIVDPETLQELPADRVGELLLWDRVGNVAGGYYKNPEATEATFNVYYTDLNGKKSDHGWLRTGDLCFIHKGSVYICGRSKDLIIICGRNIYPHDVEAAAVEAKPALISKGGAIAFSVSHFKGVDEEQLCVVLEVPEETRKDPANYQEIYKAVNENINDKFSAKAAYIVILKEGDLPRTASHKVSRAPCKKMLLEKKLNIIDAYPSKDAFN